MAVFIRPNYGTVSTGTLIPEDLLESFSYELGQQKPLHDQHRMLLRNIAHGIVKAARPVYVDRLISALNTYAPNGFYFGASETDPADFGFWPRYT